jgi:hypothetical protein
MTSTSNFLLFLAAIRELFNLNPLFNLLHLRLNLHHPLIHRNQHHRNRLPNLKSACELILKRFLFTKGAYS